MVDVAKAIQYAHENGVLHRDLKPSNILVGKSGLPYVADFGLAKNIGESQSLTGSGDLLGTPAYMSPEQATGRGKSGRAHIGVASDIYSLGAILYHMVTGRPPFQASTPVDTILMVIEQDTISPRMLNRRVDRDLEMIVMKCLQKPQDLRYESADELAEDLQAFLRNEPVSARQGRFGQVIGSWFRETHHAIVLENWGLLWMWHSVALLVACLATNILQWTITDKNVWWPYVLLWTVGFGAWAMVFWFVRRSMGPVTFVERQVAHVWAASFFCVVALFPLERMLQLAPLTLSPVLALIAGMTFLIKAGILSGVFYIAAAAMLITFYVMSRSEFDQYDHMIFGVVCASCFFLIGLKYYRRRRKGNR
jgi:serine/threonine-protein kinase